MAELRQYDPLQVVAAWSTSSVLGTLDIVDGVIDGGDFLVITEDNPTWTREHDNRGNATRIKNANRGGRLALTLSASSPTNLSLTRAAELDATGESVVGSMLIRDLNGDKIIEADGAFLVGIPDISFGSDRGSRIWTWECAAIRKHIGGHDIAG